MFLFCKILMWLDFSTKQSTDYSGLVLVGAAILVVLGLLGYFFMQSGQK